MTFSTIPWWRRFPWLPAFLAGLAYMLLGWHLSVFDIFWEIGAFIGAIALTTALIWGGGGIARLLRLGPRSIFTMLLLSAAVTLAVIASSVFALIVIVLAAEALARVEMKSLGFGPISTLSTLTVIAAIGLSAGWIWGHYFPSSTYWLMSGTRNFFWDLIA
ncbi:MAG: hypothetical protein KME35_14805 [Aphanocapsa sp. GSE-SYN-MK-11-07L]|jgi:hypothetical protein|nr:hypothetical protein [Aphanocapsa sp. GSE-SYN-MK-11-07L]